MNTIKRYELLKDLPSVKAGGLYELDGKNNYYRSVEPCEDGTHIRWPISCVEDNPTWFKLIIKENKEFVWTDEFVQEYAANIILERTNHPTTAKSYLEHFKASKQQLNTTKEETGNPILDRNEHQQQNKRIEISKAEKVVKDAFDRTYDQAIDHCIKITRAVYARNDEIDNFFHELISELSKLKINEKE